MSLIKKIFFWIFVIIIGFVNPVFSGIVIVCYYLPKVLQDYFDMKNEPNSIQEMNSYSNDILEEMK